MAGCRAAPRARSPGWRLHSLISPPPSRSAAPRDRCQDCGSPGNPRDAPCGRRRPGEPDRACSRRTARPPRWPLSSRRRRARVRAPPAARCFARSPSLDSPPRPSSRPWGGEAAAQAEAPRRPGWPPRRRTGSDSPCWMAIVVVRRRPPAAAEERSDASSPVLNPAARRRRGARLREPGRPRGRRPAPRRWRPPCGPACRRGRCDPPARGSRILPRCRPRPAAWWP